MGEAADVAAEPSGPVAPDGSHAEPLHWKGQGEGTTRQGLVLPKLWLGLAVPLAFVLESTAFFLYAALELDWSTFDSWWGVVVIMACPLAAGAGIGLAFENMKQAVLLAWAVGISASIASAVLFASPYTMGVVDNTGIYSGLAWTAGFVSALAALPLGAIGAALAVSANTIE